MGADDRPPLRRRGLGMGLSALLGNETGGLVEADGGGGPRSVPVAFLKPSRFQPRRRFDEDELEALTESVRAKGVIQPLLVRRAADGSASFEIVAGERRWRAAQAAGLHEVPVVLRELSDSDALEAALVENLQRADLSPVEEGLAFRRLIDEFGHTQEELARILGKSRSHVANTLRLLGLPEEIQSMIADGRLSAGHARALIGVEGALDIAREIVARALNVRQTEALVRARNEQATKPRAAKTKNPDLVALERDLSDRLGLRVTVADRGKGGTLTIAYSSLDQLDGLLRRLA